MKIHQGDKVIVITGKDKGKTGAVTRVIKKTGKIVVEKVNFATKHIKKSNKGPGDKVKVERPISVSNVMLICPQTNKRTRVGYKILEDGKKVRFCKVSDYILDQKKAATTKAKK
jgi:large subunit ribosomal protein L24